MRYVLVLCVTFVLWGCAGPLLPLGDIQSEYSTPERVPEGTAKVIVGTQLTFTPSIMDTFFSRGNYFFAAYNLDFAPIDPVERQVFGKQRGFAVKQQNTSCYISVTPDCYPYNKMMYKVFAIPPGSYAIETYTIARGGPAPTHITRFFKRVPSQGMRTERLERDPITGDSSIFYWTFVAGETVYVGDFTFDPAFFPIKIVSFGRNDEAARQALHALNLPASGEIKFQAMRSSRGYKFGPKQNEGLFSIPQPVDETLK